jgi:LysM repeat protein
MKPRRFYLIGGLLLAGVHFCAPAWGQQTVAQQLAIIEERVNQLREEIKAMQFNQEQMQQQIRDLQAQVTDLRRSGSGVSEAELKALEAQIKAVDAAREKDRQIILDQLAKELVAISKGRNGGTVETSGVEHVVATGETLSTIARAYGVTVSAIAQANGITDTNVLRVGQKLIIPK